MNPLATESSVYCTTCMAHYLECLCDYDSSDDAALTIVLHSTTAILPPAPLPSLYVGERLPLQSTQRLALSRAYDSAQRWRRFAFASRMALAFAAGAYLALVHVLAFLFLVTR